eukprot:SAG11_NODE_3411_length_2464_cov_1.506977_1_plen_63_part_10
MRERDWLELSERQRHTAASLGWGCLSWSTGTRPTPRLNRGWEELGLELRHAASATLGITEADW